MNKDIIVFPLTYYYLKEIQILTLSYVSRKFKEAKLAEQTRIKSSWLRYGIKHFTINEAACFEAMEMRLSQATYNWRVGRQFRIVVTTHSQWERNLESSLADVSFGCNLVPQKAGKKF